MTILKVRKVKKPWGRVDLPAPFVNDGADPIGEIWFEPSPALDQLLVKYIFTSENLSVQCHPSDEQTLAQGLGHKGKEECWLVLDAEPGARIAVGFNEPLDAETIRRTAHDGSIEQLLTWHPAASGDFFYIPANTVHAIGAGISLIEIQQNSDITYRLYDYGRPRELHLEEGIKIASSQLYSVDNYFRIPSKGSVNLVDGPLFRLSRTDGPPDDVIKDRYRDGKIILLPLDCTLAIGNVMLFPGECGLAPNLDVVAFPQTGLCLIAQPL